MIALFLALSIWLLATPADGSGGGAGPGSGGGGGGGSGGGIGTGVGTGTLADAGAADAPGEGRDEDGTGPAQGDGEAASQEAREAPSSRPPLRVGFTAPTESRAPPAPPAPAAAPARGGRAGGASGGGGGSGDHSFMGVEGRGKRVVYVIDRSGSMNGDRLSNTRYELKRSIRALPADGEFFVIFFDQRALPMPAPGLVPATGANKDRYSKWIDQQTAGGGTDPTEALLQALALGPDSIYLMSDGVFDAASAQAVRAANGSECIINAIAFHDPAGEEVLKRIARENGGAYRFVAPP